MPTQEYYPALKDLINAEAIPGDFTAMEDLIQSGIDLVLAKIWYKDLVVDISSTGETKHYSLTILTKRLSVPILGSGMNLVFFRDSTGTLSAFPLAFEWKWALQRYIDGLESQGFSYAPEAFVEILMELAEIDSRKDFFKGIVSTFLNDGDDAYQTFLTELSTRVSDYDNGTAGVTTEINNIVNQLDSIKTTVVSFLSNVSIYSPLDLLENYEQSPALLNAVNSIKTSIETLDRDYTVDIDLTADIIRVILDGFSDLDEKFDRLGELFRSWFGDIGIDDIKELLIPQFAIELQDIKLALEFPRNWLIPALESPASSGNYIEDPDTNKLAALEFTVGNLKYSTQKGFEFDDQYAFTFERAFIGKTGIMLAFSGLKVDMSDAYNIPEAEADGRPEDFQGVYADSASVTLPAKWFKDPDGTNAEIFGERLLIGTGGLSGRVGLKALGGDNMFWASLGESDGFRLGFKSFDILFKQNKVLESNIQGAMEIKKFVYPAGTLDENGVDVSGQTVTIGIAGHIHDDGDFNLTASATPPYPIEFPDVFTYHIGSLELGKEEDDFYIGTSGKLEFMGFLKDTLKLKEIEIDRLRIYSDGSIEFEGGSIALIEPIVLNLGPVEITVSAIHYGSHQKEVDGVMRKFNYFGFDGGISVDPLGVEIRGDGVKFYYCTDDLPNKPSSYLHIQTLYLDLTIPSSSPAAIINGWLSIPEPGTSPEYAGGIKLQLPQAKISGSADMKLQPRYPAFIIDASIDLPAPITIGPVGIYGFRGLIGYRYVAEKEAAGLTSGVDSWYDYYKTPPRGIHVTKFNGPDRTTASGTPFSIGAGASLGTSFDNGTVLNIKAMVLLSIPSLFMIDGRAAILSARLGLDDAGDPPFFAFIAIGDNSLELGFGADFKMPSSNGNILKLYADVQAGFFFNDSSKWYINIGTKTNPVTARVLTLVTITSYLMLSAKGIEAGARGEFDFKRKYGPIKVHAWAYIEVGGKISFEKPQFGAYLAAGVGADIDIKIVSLYASFDVLFGVESPKPFLIYGEFRLCVKIKIMWVFKFKFCGNLSISWEFNSTVDRTPISPLVNPANNDTIPSIVRGVNMLSNETFDLAYLGSSIPAGLSSAILDKIIPIDTYIDIKSEKGLLPNAISNIIGGVNNPAERHVEMVPPQKIIKGKEVRQVKHQYSIESLVIKSWNPQTSSWNDYNPYKALYPSDPTLDTLKIGQFQKDGKQYNTIRLLATTPFSYTEQGQPGWTIPEQNGITSATLFCEAEQEVEECANFLGKPLGTKYYCFNENQLFYSNQVAFLLLNRDDFDHAIVANVVNPFAFDQSLKFQNENGLQIRLQEPSVEVSLKLTSFASSVEIRYYASLMDDGAMQVQYGNPDTGAANTNEPYSVVVPSSSLNSPVAYSEPGWLPITRIEIQPILGNQQEINDLIEQIAQIEEYNNQIALGNIKDEPQSTTELQSKLNELLAIGCTIEEGEPCQRDEKLCALYDFVLQVLGNCLVDPKMYKEEDLKKYLDCVQSIYNQLIGLMGGNPPTELKEIAVILNNFLKDPNLQTYQEVWKALQNLIRYLIEVGKCDCQEEGDKCYTALHQVCWLTLEQYQYNINIPGQAAIEADAQAAIDGITQYIQPVWRPNTHFVINFALKDVVDDGASSPGNYSFTYGFTTAGPVGFFHKDEKATYGDIELENGNILEDANGIIRTPGGAIVSPDPLNPITPHPDNYALTNLKRYIDYNRSYPNADGNLLSSKPLFYDDETTRISLFFTKAYATHFFHNWESYNGNDPLDGRLKIVIKDPREGDSIVNPPYLDYDPADTQYTNIPQTIESWENDPDPLVPHIFQMYQNLIDSNECIPFGGNAIIPPSQFMNVIPKHLKPMKLYTALVNNLFDRDGNGTLVTEEVHRFGFQTSRYATFKEQVESYFLSNEDGSATANAVFRILKDISPLELDAAYDTIVGTPNSLSDDIAPNYQHAFDRVIEGILALPPMEKAVTTEVNVIRNTSDSDKIIGLLIRNPEPFNNPKIPISDITETIQVVNGAGIADASFKRLFSKDYSQVLIIPDSKEIVASSLNVKFEYKLWNGTSYIVPGLPEYSTDEVGTITISNIDVQNA